MLSKKTLAAPFLISSLLLVSCSDSSSNTTSSSNDLSGSFQKENYVDEGAMEKCRKLFFKAQYQQGSTSRIYIDPQTNKITRHILEVSLVILTQTVLIMLVSTITLFLEKAQK